MRVDLDSVSGRDDSALEHTSASGRRADHGDSDSYDCELDGFTASGRGSLTPSPVPTELASDSEAGSDEQLQVLCPSSPPRSYGATYPRSEQPSREQLLKKYGIKVRDFADKHWHEIQTAPYYDSDWERRHGDRNHPRAMLSHWQWYPPTVTVTRSSTSTTTSTRALCAHSSPPGPVQVAAEHPLRRFFQAPSRPRIYGCTVTKAYGNLNLKPQAASEAQGRIRVMPVLTGKRIRSSSSLQKDAMTDTRIPKKRKHMADNSNTDQLQVEDPLARCQAMAVSHSSLADSTMNLKSYDRPRYPLDTPRRPFAAIQPSSQTYADYHGRLQDQLPQWSQAALYY